MAKPSQISQPGKYTKCAWCNYAYPGYGKTSLLGTAGEAGLKLLLIRPPTDSTIPIIGSGVDEWVVNSHDDLTEVEEFARHSGDEYDWLGVDSVSLLQDHLLDDVWASTIAKFPHRKGGPVDKGEYNINFTRIQRLFRDLHRGMSAGMYNLFWTAHPMELEDVVTGEDKLQPWVQGKNMSTKLQGYMHIVSYMDMTPKGRRRLHFNATKDYVAKNQYEKFGAFPDGKMLDPTMAKIMAELEKAGNTTGKSTTSRKRPTKGKRRATRR